MADIGCLRRVEVLSTVSGGSIIGALYYLHLKDLLENVPDADVTDEDYRTIVQRIENTLLTGVQTHLRARALTGLLKNFCMAKPDYSRSDRMGELYDSTFYRPAWDSPLCGEQPAASEGGMIRMRELRIVPCGYDGEFDPDTDNGARRARVPVLVLNATSLNTGHNWRFEAIRMGEPSREEEAWLEVDKNTRLKSRSWATIAERQQDFELGLAVAASACVPGLFHPLAVSGLFVDEAGEPLRVELVDGGVHDNQGVGALVDRGCEQLIVSDASGQMRDEVKPSTRIYAALGRSSSIYGDRVREEQLVGAWQSPRPLALLHLRKGLPACGLSPRGADGSVEGTTTPGIIDYGVYPKVQRLLSEVRTDLDSFSEVEANSLALYGYLMGTSELDGVGCGEAVGDHDLGEFWTFWQLREEIEVPSPEYLRQLDVASKKFFKAARLSAAGKVKAAAMAVLTLGGIVLLAAGLSYLLGLVRPVGEILDTPVPLGKTVVVLLVVLSLVGILIGLYLKPTFRVPGARWLADLIYERIVPVVMAPSLYLVAWATLWMHGDFLEAGRLEAVLGQSEQGEPVDE